MRRAFRQLALLILAVAVSTPAFATSRLSLDSWVERELLPFVREQLTTHPRFKGETVLFVALDGNSRAAVSDGLSLALRDRLVDAAVTTSGIAIAWQQGRGTAGAATIDCTRDDVHYYIGIDVRVTGGDARVTLRALDVEQGSWVSGFGLDWRGSLNRSESRAYGTRQSDQTFLGARDVPFSANQTDLLARHIAHELSCALLRETSGSYVIDTQALADDDSSQLNGMLELVGVNVAANAAIDLAGGTEQANAELVGKAHPIDRNLFQYWLTVRPLGDDDLSAISASAYIRLPTGAGDVVASAPPTVAVVPRTVSTASISVPNASGGAFIAPLTLAAGRDGSLLRTTARADSIVFFIQHDPLLGIVRLGDHDCRQRTIARLARSGDVLRFPVAYTSVGSREVHETVDWYVSPQRTTYYAIAVSDERTARRIANHIDRLPMRCGRSSRPGLTGGELEGWLETFAEIAARSARHIDWRAIEVKDVL
ncbi:MAG: hypothetical protein QNJ00_17190 [Woeseiaceae bacterium]|nr:hypothetical protein [Woeseiaceae bacterium]